MTALPKVLRPATATVARTPPNGWSGDGAADPFPLHLLDLLASCRGRRRPLAPVPDAARTRGTIG
jgi:hypothetical protein